MHIVIQTRAKCVDGESASRLVAACIGHAHASLRRFSRLAEGHASGPAFWRTANVF
jgi:hypothetical protein